MIRPNLVKVIGPVGCCGSAQAACLRSAKKLSGGSASSGVNRGSAEPRPAVGTEDRVGFGHIDVDMRVVLRWGHANALEFPHPDADFGDAAVVSELRIAAAPAID